MEVLVKERRQRSTLCYQNQGGSCPPGQPCAAASLQMFLAKTWAQEGFPAPDAGAKAGGGFRGLGWNLTSGGNWNLALVEAACDAEVKAGSGLELRGGESRGQADMQRAKEAGARQ